MGRIRVLSDVLASQVAAGEVVERPASVVKELVENSLDAGAWSIEISADRGGVALLRVVDDGGGMGREDALLSIERHATSKLREAGDLAMIRTLGFRGEALPSIASVSRFTLSSREPQALAGTALVVEGGTLRDVRDWGGAPGTVVEVRDLFFNVPARRKFLRSENTEFGHLEQTVRVQALAHPEVGFTLLRDGRVVFQLPGRGSLRSRIAGLVGAEVAGGLVECPPAELGGLHVHGWLAAAGRTRSDRSLMLTFVNGRPVENSALTYALRTAYGDTLARGQHPVCFLFVEMDPAVVDVNVHPSKREVRFRDGLGVQASLAAILQEALRAATGRTACAPPSRSEIWPPPRKTAPPPEEHPAPVVRMIPPAATQMPLRSQAPPAVTAGRGDPLPGSASSAPPPPATANPVPFRLLGQLAQSYAVLEGDEGLVLMDLRGSHERILYETLRRRATESAAPSQPLLVPVVLPLPPRDYALVREHLSSLSRLGFGIEEFGANTIKIDALPAVLAGDDPAAVFTGLLDDLAHSGESGAQRRYDFDSLAASVSALAVPRQTARSTAEIESLLTRLLACEMPYCDPLGRPTLIQFSHQELARKFGRRV